MRLKNLSCTTGTACCANSSANWSTEHSTKNNNHNHLSYCELTLFDTMSSKRSTRRSRRSQTPVNVLLTEIRSTSTCISLAIPNQLACGVCSPKMDITTNSRKRKHNQRQLSERRKCQQYWDDKWLSRKYQSNANMKKYKDVREYLNINSTNLDINSETYVHANKYKSAKALSTHPSSPSSSHSSSSTPSVI